MDGPVEPGRSLMRWYGSAIAVVSGLYSVYVATTGTGMTGGAWFMLALGAIVLVHGLLLLTPAHERLGAASGPLMMVWALLMLGNQAWLAWTGGPDGMPMAGGMSWDAGMVALAAVMLVSGAIMMTARGGEPRTGM
jgi:hypothetical protein